MYINRYRYFRGLNAKPKHMKISITASEYEKKSIIYIHKYWNEM